MANRTPNRGYLYPECDPPLVKDRSDIDFLRAFADDVNNDAITLDARIRDWIELPDAARIAYASTVTVSSTPGAMFIMPYTSISYDNTGISTDLANNALRPRERGWYLFASSVRCTNGGSLSMMVRHLRNGGVPTESFSFEGPSEPIGVEENMTVMSALFCDGDDLITTQVRTDGAGGTFTFDSRLSMIQLQKLDV